MAKVEKQEDGSVRFDGKGENTTYKLTLKYIYNMAKKIIDLSSIIIEKLIVHDIPKHKKSEIIITPSYSEQESSTTDGMRVFFKGKITAALLGKKSFKICIDPKKDSPVPLYIKNILKKDKDSFVSDSKKIADRLLASQDGVNAAGILLVISGKISDKNTCIILKLERDNGIQLELNTETNSFDLIDIKNLMLTQKTKIFKVALFIQRDDFDIKYDGFLTDYQIDMKAKKEIQTFFMDNFLGCVPFQDPKFSTQKFYNYTRTYIDTLDDEIVKAKYTQDLNSYIQKNQGTVNPREFAEDYFETPEDKDNYKKYLVEKGFSFDNAYLKDTALIINKIRKITITFENDISIIGNKGTIDDKVQLIKLDNGQHKAEIISKIKNVI